MDRSFDNYIQALPGTVGPGDTCVLVPLTLVPRFR